MSWYNNNNNDFIDATQISSGSLESTNSAGETIINVINITSNYVALADDVFIPKQLNIANSSYDTIIVNNTPNSRIFLKNSNTTPKVKIENGKLYLLYDYDFTNAPTIYGGWIDVDNYITAIKQQVIGIEVLFIPLEIYVFGTTPTQLQGQLGAINLVLSTHSGQILTLQEEVAGQAGLMAELQIQVNYLNSSWFDPQSPLTPSAFNNSMYNQRNIFDEATLTALNNARNQAQGSAMARFGSSIAGKGAELAAQYLNYVLIGLGGAGALAGLLFSVWDSLTDESAVQLERKTLLLYEKLDNNPANDLPKHIHKDGLSIVSATNNGFITFATYKITLANQGVIRIKTNGASLPATIESVEEVGTQYFNINDIINVPKTSLGGTSGNLQIQVLSLISERQVLFDILGNIKLKREAVSNRRRLREGVVNKDQFGAGFSIVNTSTITNAETGEVLQVPTITIAGNAVAGSTAMVREVNTSQLTGSVIDATTQSGRQTLQNTYRSDLDNIISAIMNKTLMAEGLIKIIASARNNWYNFYNYILTNYTTLNTFGKYDLFDRTALDYNYKLQAHLTASAQQMLTDATTTTAKYIHINGLQILLSTNNGLTTLGYYNVTLQNGGILEIQVRSEATILAFITRIIALGNPTFNINDIILIPKSSIGGTTGNLQINVVSLISERNIIVEQLDLIGNKIYDINNRILLRFGALNQAQMGTSFSKDYVNNYTNTETGEIINYPTINLKPATTTLLGGIKSDNDTMNIDGTGILSLSGNNKYLTGGVNSRIWSWTGTNSYLGRVGTAGDLFTTSLVSDIVLRSDAGRVVLQAGGINDEAVVLSNTTLTTNRTLQVGTSTGGGIINFGGITDDAGFALATIQTRSYATDKSELLLFKGDDIQGLYGADRIRLRAGAIAFDAFDVLSTNPNAENIRMYIQGNGNVGIGTTSVPFALLHLHKPALTQDVRIQFTDATTGATTTDGLVVGKATNGKCYVYNYENTDLYFATNSTERLTILAGGAVGIGTNVVPYAFLHLHKSALTQDVRIQFTDSTSGAGANDGVIVGKLPDGRGFLFNYESFGLFFGTSGLERMMISSTGLVGIGTATPTTGYLLDVNGSGIFRASLLVGSTTNSSVDDNTAFAIPDATLYVRGVQAIGATTNIVFRGGLQANSNGKVKIWMANDASHSSYIESDHTGNGKTNLMFGTAGGNVLPTEKMRINQDGNVGIGTTSPNDFLHLHKNTANTDVSFTLTDLTTGSAFGNGFRIRKMTTEDVEIVNGHNKDLIFGANNTNFMRIKDYGAVGIQTNGYAIANNYMWGGSLTIGNIVNNYGGGTTSWNTSTAGLLMECLDSTEIAVHDSGQSIHSFMRYTTNGNFTIGRDMGHGTSTLSVAGQLLLSTGTWHSCTNGNQRFYYAGASTSYYRGHGTTPHVWRNGSDQDLFYVYSTGEVVFRRTTDNAMIGNLDMFGVLYHNYYSSSGSGQDYTGVPDVSTTSGTINYREIKAIHSTFTGYHRCYIDDEICNNENDEYLDIFKNEYVGRIVISTGKIKTDLTFKKEGDEREKWYSLEDKEGITIEDALPIVQLSRIRKDKRIYGVLGDPKRKSNNIRRIIINGCGEGAIAVANTNGNIENGDYIQTSDLLGYGEKQDDDLHRNYTVAKAVMDCTFELDNPNYECKELSNGTRVALIACVYKAS